MQRNPSKANCANRVKLFWIHVKICHFTRSVEDPRRIRGRSAEELCGRYESRSSW